MVAYRLTSFNPSVGILFVHTKGWQCMPARLQEVSIPRSGFCLFILDPGQGDTAERPGFNPSVGILFVHTRSAVDEAGWPAVFQSLGRDSVCSYYNAPKS